MANGVKQPYYIYPSSEEFLLFAAIWSEYVAEDTGEILYTCALLTTDAADKLQPIHHRKPVMLKEEDFKYWLDNSVDSKNHVNVLEQKCIAEMSLDYHKVNRKVNNPRFNIAECIEPIAG